MAATLIPAYIVATADYSRDLEKAIPLRMPSTSSNASALPFMPMPVAECKPCKGKTVPANQQEQVPWHLRCARKEPSPSWEPDRGNNWRSNVYATDMIGLRGSKGKRMQGVKEDIEDTETTDAGLSSSSSDSERSEGSRTNNTQLQSLHLGSTPSHPSAPCIPVQVQSSHVGLTGSIVAARLAPAHPHRKILPVEAGKAAPGQSAAAVQAFQKTPQQQMMPYKAQGNQNGGFQASGAFRDQQAQNFGQAPQQAYGANMGAGQPQGMQNGGGGKGKDDVKELSAHHQAVEKERQEKLQAEIAQRSRGVNLYRLHTGDFSCAENVLIRHKWLS